MHRAAARVELRAVEDQIDALEVRARQLRAEIGDEFENPAPGYRGSHWGHGGSTPVLAGCTFADPRGKIVEMGDLTRVAYRATKAGFPADAIFTHTFKHPPKLAYSQPEGLLAVASPPGVPRYKITMRGIEG